MDFQKILDDPETQRTVDSLEKIISDMTPAQMELFALSLRAFCVRALNRYASSLNNE
tara:strand:+ start:955 stop:1125 length:171 start_codon:yes stop_codon:yes gene_type:complete